MRLNIVMISCFLMTCCKNKTNDNHSNKFICIKQFVQNDAGKPRLFRVEKFDTTGKHIQTVDYFFDEELISSIERFFYDSLNRLNLKRSVFIHPKVSSSKQILYHYNVDGLLIKSIIIEDNSGDSAFIYLAYNSAKRLKSVKFISNVKSIRSGIQEYIYDKDSLIKIFRSDLKGKNSCIEDSFIYFKNGKVKYTNNTTKGFDIDTFFYQNKMLARRTYDGGEVKYFYDSQNKLIKEEHICKRSGCLVSQNPIERTIYTYVYEK